MVFGVRLLRELQAARRFMQCPQVLAHLLEVGFASGNLGGTGGIQQRPHLFIEFARKGLQLLLTLGAFRFQALGLRRLRQP